MYREQVIRPLHSSPSASPAERLLTEAAEIANHASAVVVSKLETAIVTRDELMASFREESEGGERLNCQLPFSSIATARSSRMRIIIVPTQNR